MTRLRFLVLALGTAVTALAAGVFHNPILPGHHSDPSVCRVGDDYYLVTSSFEWFPGVPVYHSRDLVHWELIGHVLDRPSQLDLDGVESSGGIFAATIRYHAGTFYLITTLNGVGKRGGNFVVTAKNPAGPWSEPHFIAGAQGIDPSLFFDDDGRAYYCGNGRPEKLLTEKHRLIWVQQLDLATWKLVGPRGVLDSAKYFAWGALRPVNNFEGPHLYKKDGAYYLMLSHGGTGLHHAVSIWRGTSPLGPFTDEDPHNPIVTHRGEHPDGITCTGHADLVETQRGKWWMVLLGVRANDANTAMGRETFLVPVDWSAAWPVVNPRGRVGRVEAVMPAPDLPAFHPPVDPARDDFSGVELAKHWSMLRTPRTRWWDLQQRPGWLTLALRPETLTGRDDPSFLARPQEQAECVATGALDFTPRGPGERAGIAILRARDAVFELAVEADGAARRVSIFHNGRREGSCPVGPGVVRLRIRVHGPELAFACSAGTGAWVPVGTADGSILISGSLGRFTGTYAGPFATTDGRPGGNSAAFDWFELR